MCVSHSSLSITFSGCEHRSSVPGPSGTVLAEHACLPAAFFLTEATFHFRANVINTVMCHLTMGTHSEKCITRRFHCCVIVTERTCTNLDGVACDTPRLCGVACCSQTPACIERCRTKQHETKSSARENDAIKTHDKHET